MDHIVKYPGSISLQVQGAADPEAAAQALTGALAEIETLGQHSRGPGGEPLTPNSVGGVAMVPGGPFITSIKRPHGARGRAGPDPRHRGPPPAVSYTHLTLPTKA